MTFAIPRTTEGLIMSVLTDQPMTVGEIIEAIGDRTALRVFRKDANATLNALALRSLVAPVDEPGHQRRWVAVPGA